MEENKFETKPFFLKCIIIESVAVLLVILSVLIIKYTSPKLFVKLKNFYTEKILDETKIEEVLEEKTAYEI